MKQFHTILLLLLAFAGVHVKAQDVYNSQWKKVDALIQKKKLPKTALTIVKRIYAQAKKDKNEVQLMKALIYRFDLQQETRENNEAAAIAEAEKEIKGSREPYTSVFNSLLAELYWKYFQEHRWQFYNRTATEKKDTTDIAKWGITEFHQKIGSLYKASLQNKELLQKTLLQPLSILIVKGNVSHLRPTLYDLLAFKALTYFENDERYITKPEYFFTLSDPKLFGPATDFAKLSIQTKDTTSLSYKALNIYQDLLLFHRADQRKEALIDVDIKRIAFVYRNAEMKEKDSLYKEALQRLLKDHEGNKAIYQAGYFLAEQLNQLAGNYAPFGDTIHRFERVNAELILQKIVGDSTEKNEGWTNSFNLLQQIRKPSLSFTVEKVNLPLEPFRALVTYRNVQQVYVQVIPASQKMMALLDEANNEDRWKILAKQKGIKSWWQSLPATNDLQEHATEIKLAALPAGQYFLVLSTESNMAKANAPAAVKNIWVSNISYVNRGNDFFVLHRKTGKPLVGASVDVFDKVYNDKLSRYIPTITGRYTTNERGFCRVKGKDVSDYDSYLTFRYKGEMLSLDEDVYLNRFTDEERRTRAYTNNVFFYTDRAVYRPGQTIQFKAILVKNGSRSEKSVVTNYPLTVYLYDANGEKRDSVKLTSNEFGSVAGKFTLSTRLLNGRFSLRTKIEGDDSQRSFSVEEYKRPKFYVSFDKVESAYKMDDSIHLVVNAKAYAGNNVSGADAAYTVTRSNRVYGGRRWRPYQSQQIAHGKKQTDADGKLVISFLASPDKKIDSALNPVFDFRVSIAVTDINGETHNETQTISVGYTSLELSAFVPEKLQADSLNQLSIETRNLQGQFVETALIISLYRLSPENRLLRLRFWEQPDQFVMSKEEYVAAFPYDEYKNERDYQSWPKELVQTFSAVSTEAGNVAVKWNKPLPVGDYLLQVTATDNNGRQITIEEHLELFGKEKTSKPEFLWTYKSGGFLRPGEYNDIILATAAQDIHLISETDRGKKELRDTTRFQYGQLHEEIKNFRFDAAETDRGGYNFGFLFVKENRVYHYDGFVEVLWSNKELKVDLATFRDKTEPGAKETWKLKISGEGGRKVATEMLASMYDASLDAFSAHSWNKPSVWRYYRQGLAWADEDFRMLTSEEKDIELTEREFSKEYDVFLFDKVAGDQQLWWLNPLDYRYSDAGWGRVGATDSSAVIDPSNPDKILKMVVASGYMRGKREELAYGLGSNYMMAPTFNSYNDDVAPARGNVYKKEGEFFIHADGVADKLDQASGIERKQIIQPRKNLSETAFFYPFLTTDENGDVELSFTAPEALTKWKLQTFAHTKDLAFGTTTKEMLTQKSLMVQPNVPRFVRQKDALVLQAKISNLSAEAMTGEARLQLFDAATNEPVDASFAFPQNALPFTVKGSGSAVVDFPLSIPETFNSSLTWRITAVVNKGNEAAFSDGEEAILPVLPNKILVTETWPLVLRGETTREIKLDKLLQSAGSTTIRHQSLVVEATTNPAWYVVQALPYLMEFPFECAEQTWNRYYANALASMIANSSPGIQQLFQKWKNDTSVLQSNLQKNEELKSSLLQETPWVLEAKTEAAQKRAIAMLFDKGKTDDELARSLARLRQLQKSSGAFSWFAGGPDNRYITQYILTGIGRLMKANNPGKQNLDELLSLIRRALPYLDKQAELDYELIEKNKFKSTGLTSDAIHYLYMRSFYKDRPVPKNVLVAYNYFKLQASQNWQEESKQLQGMVALALHRDGDKKTPAAILASLKETAILSEERGMYWKQGEDAKRWHWQQAPVETVALMVEVFAEAGKDKEAVFDLQTWLIQNKRTNHWATTKATADACYAIIMQNPSLLNEGAYINVTLGSNGIKPVAFSSMGARPEEGAGYFKKTVAANEILPAMGMVNLQVKAANNTIPVWTNIYWQYFENIDNFTGATSPLQVYKETFIERNTPEGPKFFIINDSSVLKTSDKLKVRIQLKTDRDMEYVHLKDLRASCFEPLNVFSGYRWQNGTGYYETTKDASTNFFFDRLPKGSYVFEYLVYVGQNGSFSNGIATVQCMYAPEFSAHSEGMRLNVK